VFSDQGDILREEDQGKGVSAHGEEWDIELNIQYDIGKPTSSCNADLL